MSRKCSTLAVAIFYCVISINAQPILRFHRDSTGIGTFKIAQFTDLHFGEGEDTSWGPIQDKNSTRVMDTILRIEKPDLVVLTGDMITGNNIRDNATVYWRQMVDPMMRAGTPWAIVFGNHDDLASGVNGTREDLMEFDTSFPLSLSQFGTARIHGVSNYALPVMSSASEQTPATFLRFFDSGDSGCLGQNGWSCVHPDQVEWYVEAAAGSSAPSLAFFHIPLQEHMFLWNEQTVSGWNNDTVSCQALNTGLFSAFKEVGDVQAVFVGHNHGNDFCGQYDGVLLCFGRHTGYGGYGDWERGARIIQLSETPWHVQTWVRYEDGRREDRGPLHAPAPPLQTQCD